MISKLHRENAVEHDTWLSYCNRYVKSFEKPEAPLAVLKVGNMFYFLSKLDGYIDVLSSDFEEFPLVPQEGDPILLYAAGSPREWEFIILKIESLVQ
jgi:hypothetical protein